MNNICKVCKKIIKKRPREGNTKRKFCSQSCYKIYQKTHLNSGCFKIGNHPKTEFKKGNPKPKNAYTFPSGAKHPLWKGNNAKYSAFHMRLKERFGYPKECRVCGTTDKHKRYEWANLTGKLYDIKDYKRMCHSCHKKYDWAKKKVNHFL